MTIDKKIRETIRTYHSILTNEVLDALEFSEYEIKRLKKELRLLKNKLKIQENAQQRSI